MRWAQPAGWLGRRCSVLVIVLCVAGIAPAAQAHGQHKRNTTKALQGPNPDPLAGILRPPPNADYGLYSTCVLKYQNDLVVPPPMPVNTAPRPQNSILTGPGTFDFTALRPVWCSEYDQQYDQQYPYGYYPIVEEVKVQEHMDEPGLARHKLEAYPQRRRPNKHEQPHRDEYHRSEHNKGEHYRGNMPFLGKPYQGDKPYPGKPQPGSYPPKDHHRPDYHPYRPPHKLKPSYPKPDYAMDPPKKDYSKRYLHPGEYPADRDPYPGEYPADLPYQHDHPEPWYPPYDTSPNHGYPGDQPYGDDYGYNYGPPPECTVDSFKEYQISVKQISQPSLGTPATNAPPPPAVPGYTCPTTFGPTKVFAYGPTNVPAKFNWPAYTIEAQRFNPNRIQWNNELVDGNRNYLPHILNYAVDQTIHWANPGGGNFAGIGIDESPCMGCPGACVNAPACTAAADPAPYSGPVPIVTHVHGMEDVRDYSDGYTEAWYMPDANNLATGLGGPYAPYGTWYKKFEEEYFKDTNQHYAKVGSADFIYPNTQRPSTAWYHDHTLGLTRLNVYSGMAGFYFIRDFLPVYAPGVQDTGPELPGIPYPPPSDLTAPQDVREIPLAIQDRMFQQNGDLWYPVKAADTANDLPNGDLPPKWVPEFPFVSTLNNQELIMMTVNGRVWPQTSLTPDAYRLRLLNGCNARTLTVQFARTDSTVKEFTNFNVPLTDPPTPPIPVPPADQVPFWVIGNEAGFFPQVQGPFQSLTMGPAERYDVIIDFSGFNSGDYVYMYNAGPEAVFQTGTPVFSTSQPPATVQTSQLMRFQFDPNPKSNREPKPFTTIGPHSCLAKLNKALAKTYPEPLPPATRRRRMALIEQEGANGDVKAVLLGTVNVPPANTASPELWADDVRTTTPVERVEEWEIINLTPDAHPIHLHEVVYETVGRRGISPSGLTFTYDDNKPITNSLLDPLLWVNCPYTINRSGKCPAQRDVSLILPGYATTIRFKTGKKPGLFVWHCHLVEHEDNEMMVPWCIGQGGPGGTPGYDNPKKPGTPMCPLANNPALVEPL